MNIKEISQIRRRFQDKKNKRILIYGTKAYAHRLITALSDFTIVGVLDQYQIDGFFDGIPVLDLPELQADIADLLIIGSDDRFYDVIYKRIEYRCRYLGISIFGYNGQSLDEKFIMRQANYETTAYFEKSSEKLKRLIDSFEAISFDLFDTLIMRRTLEPLDIFDLVIEKIEKKGYLFHDFRKKRRTAELNSNGKDIYCIYKELGKMLGIEDDLLNLFMQTELECERENLILRTEMAEIFNYAISKNKEVNIISDMYIPSNILKDFLHDLGIDGYTNIYVSCEYGKSKSNGLFEEYKKNIGNLKCLHIGDSKEADVIAAERYGITGYEIKSAFELLKISSIRRCLIYVATKSDRRIMGELVSRIFNNPFCLYKTAGTLRIKDLETFSLMFFVPIIMIYIQKLKVIIREDNYKGILFTSRDGYLLKKLYDSHLMDTSDTPKSFYFYTSRQLVLKATVFNKEEAELFLKVTRSIEKEELIEQTEKLLIEAEETRKNYKNYFDINGIKTDQPYLVCDLISQGTVLKGLNRLFVRKQDGLFMACPYWDASLPIKLVYGINEWYETRLSTCILERVLTSPESSVIDIDKEGQPVFSQEYRDTEEIAAIKKIHDEIIKGVEKFYNLFFCKEEISKDFAKNIFYAIEDVLFEDEVVLFNNFKVIDDTNKKVYKFIRN